MLKILCCLVLAGACLFAQSVDPAARLNPVLSKALAGTASAEDLATAILALVPENRQVSRDEVGRLANAFEGAMSGGDLREDQSAVLSRCVAGLVRGEGSNFALAAQLRDALTALKVGDQRADLIVRRFVAVGGPNDYPVKPDPFMQPTAK